MARGVPSAIKVGARDYTCREIADGAGLDISLVSRIFRGKRAPSLFAATRLAGFFRISIEQVLALVNVQVRMPPRFAICDSWQDGCCTSRTADDSKGQVTVRNALDRPRKAPRRLRMACAKQKRPHGAV